MVEISERIRSQLGIGAASASEPVGANGSMATDTMTAADDLPITLDD
jgi:hypothetical protein